MNDKAASEIDHELQAVEAMCMRAAEAGLLAEVVYLFGIEMKSGFSVAGACFHALHEWDC